MSKETRKTEETEQDAKATEPSEQDLSEVGVGTMLYRLFLVCVLTTIGAVAQNGPSPSPDPPFFAPQAYQLYPEFITKYVGDGKWGLDLSREKTLDGRVIGAEYAGRTLNFAQVSALALKRLVETAVQKGIPEREITKALRQGRFKPALQDLRLAYEGLAPLPAPPFSVQTLSAVKAARDAQWNKRFGSISELGEKTPPDLVYALVGPDPPFFAPQAYQLYPEFKTKYVGDGKWEADPSSGGGALTEKTLDGRVIGPEYSGRTLNFAQVSALALQRLVETAAQKGIPEREITKALFQGRFKPALQDLRLAYEGLAPPSPAPPYSVQTLTEVRAARTAQWNKRFGSISELGEIAPPDLAYAMVAADFTNGEPFIGATTKDGFFYEAALNFKDPAFCEKINPKAEATLGFNPEGFRGEYVKSDCYSQLAIITRRADLCAKVVPQTYFSRNGSRYSKEDCEGRIVPAGSRGMVYYWHRGTSVGADELSIFKEAGYPYAKLSRFKVQTHDCMSKDCEIGVYSRFYEYIVKEAPEYERGEFKRRLMSLNSSVGVNSTLSPPVVEPPSAVLPGVAGQKAPDPPFSAPQDDSSRRIGRDVSAPVAIYKPEPQYSEEAREAKFEGTVVLSLVVDEKGNPRDVKVIRPLGMGLDQKAIEAIEKWKFSPGTKDGRAVPAQATIEVNFRCLTSDGCVK